MHKFLKFIFGIKLYMFRTVPLCNISFSLYTQQLYMSYRFSDSLRTGSGRNVLVLLASCMKYTIVMFTVKNSWWYSEELSETCRVLIQNQIWGISASGWFYYKNWIWNIFKLPSFLRRFSSLLNLIVSIILSYRHFNLLCLTPFWQEIYLWLRCVLINIRSVNGRKKVITLQVRAYLTFWRRNYFFKFWHILYIKCE